jgi:hypothetical protein
MVEDFYRFVVLFEQNYADTHGPHYNIKEYEAAATEHALRWADRIEATASLMPPEQAKIFKEIAEEETSLLGQELKRNPKALSKRLGVEIGKRSPPVVYQRQSIGEMAIRTAVRATVWELIFSLFRR